MYHVIPEGPQHHYKKEHLDDRNQNKPVDEQYNCHYDLEDYGVEPELICLGIVQVYNVAIIPANTPEENAVPVEEPDDEKQDLHAEQNYYVVEVEVVSEPTEDWGSKQAQDCEEQKAEEENEQPIRHQAVAFCCRLCQSSLPVLQGGQE